MTCSRHTRQIAEIIGRVHRPDDRTRPASRLEREYRICRRSRRGCPLEVLLESSGGLFAPLLCRIARFSDEAWPCYPRGHAFWRARPAAFKLASGVNI